MFHGCSNLLNIKLDSFDTQRVKLMGMMFYGCQSLISLNISNFKTPIVENIGGIFGKCNKLVTIDIRNFDTNKLVIHNNILNEALQGGTIYYNSKIFNESLLNYKSIKSWTKIDVSKN